MIGLWGASIAQSVLATGYWIDGLRWGKSLRSILGPTQPPKKWIPESKTTATWSWSLPLPQDWWSCTSFMVWCLINWAQMLQDWRLWVRFPIKPSDFFFSIYAIRPDRLCGLVVRVPGYRSRGPGSIPGATRFFWEVVGLERGPLSLVSTTEELLDRKVAAAV
jgi:hypothetical protein